MRISDCGFKKARQHFAYQSAFRNRIVALCLSFVYNDARLHSIYQEEIQEFFAMRLLTIISLLLCLPLASIAQRKPRPTTPTAPQPKGQKIFPYQYTIDELPNGLHL